jgi:hypothetical protein
LLKFVASAGLGLLLAGCASRADDVRASYVSPIQYESYSCGQLREEAARVSARAAEATGTQNSKATGDAVATGVAVVLFWPAAFFIKGDGASAAELADLKGRMDAIEEENIRKKCGIEFRKS